jgi:AcrR family transcriptional regulator
MMKKQPRADAQRNKQRVLEIAQQVFATEGIAVPIDEIAKRAGVGVGTVYRHFPTKEELFLAIARRRMETLLEAARSLAEAPDPGAAFFRFLSRFIEEGAAKRDLVDALAKSGVDWKRAVGGIKKDIGRAVGDLLARAQRAGEVRKDVELAELMALVSGSFVALEQQRGDARARQRLLAVVCDGLRAK